MWKYEGSKTLSYYMRRRDFTRALALDLEVSEDVVVPTVMKQLFEGLSVRAVRGWVHGRGCAGTSLSWSRSKVWDMSTRSGV